MFDLLIFMGKIKKPPLGYFFSGVNNKLLLQSHVGSTRCTKTLISKRYITFALIATTHYFLDFSFFLRSGKDESRLMFTASWLSRSSLMRRKIKENLCDQGNHMSADEKSISQYSSFIMLKFQQNRTKPQVIRLNFVFSYLVQL